MSATADHPHIRQRQQGRHGALPCIGAIFLFAAVAWIPLRMMIMPGHPWYALFVAFAVGLVCGLVFLLLFQRQQQVGRWFSTRRSTVRIMLALLGLVVPLLLGEAVLVGVSGTVQHKVT